MPLRSKNSRIRTLVAAATLAGLGLSASPALAATTTTTTTATACQQLPTTKAFQKVDGDLSDYTAAPGGTFESGTAGWTLKNGAKVVYGNETLGVKSGSRSLQMPVGSSAASPQFCVDETNPHFRFAYKIDNAVLSGFIAYVVYRNAAGQITNIEMVSSKLLQLAPTLWKATPNQPLATLLPLSSTNKTATVQLKISALDPSMIVDDFTQAVIGENPFTKAVTSTVGTAANVVSNITGLFPGANIGVTIDSVMVDPYRRG